ncbi:DUF6980 family protein [Candidatus Tisiphia endosymbiont of Oplodontha viridula]|uniref:DUF6980 family protein n=1 Tax=Candidatus Tisiphia endosymbiont of Oplodontha viridula TaxID=3077925 RepID=UPI0035C8ABD7
MKHCCKKMEYYATQSNTLLEYSPETRSYDLWLHNDSRGTRQPISYCPWCGKILPKDLGEEWAAWVEEELGLEDIFDTDWSQLPDKYKTDEWWKKRGL